MDSDDTRIVGLEKKIAGRETAGAVQEERMKTMQAEYKTDIAMLAADNARWAEEAAKRETRVILTITGLIVAGVTILGVLIRWPS